MSPGLTEPLPTAPHILQKAPSRSIFPDGIKTSGQHPPLYDKLFPFDNFPKEISGPTVWKTEDYIHNPEQWVHPFTPEEIAEMSQAADDFLAGGTPLTGISKARKPPPRHLNL